VEFFRAKDDRLVVGLTTAQVIALTIATIGVAVMVARSGPANTRTPAAA
jgi:phosphatidylglycerol---prolipoprotein diacylglyceryl transferase